MRLVANAKAGSAQPEALASAAAVLGVSPVPPASVGRRCATANTGTDENRRRRAAALHAPDDVAAFEAAVLDGAGDTVVVAGGDGSLHVAVRALWRAGALAVTTLGLVPLGTGNDLAAGLGLPRDPAEAARVCRDGRPRPLDLLRTSTQEIVVNAGHAGLGAAAAARSVELKESLGPLAYPLGALIAGVREDAWELEVTLDDERIHAGRTLMVGVANGPSIGGGTRLCPSALPDDGLLDVVVVTAVGRAARLTFGAALRNGTHIDRDDVLHARGRRVRIAGEAVVHDIDGELSSAWTDCTYEVLPSAWRLLLPR